MVIFIVLLIFISNIYAAEEVDIPETFETAEKAISEETTYFYAGSKLLASKDSSGVKYHYQDRLGSDINSKSLPFGQSLKIENRFSFTGKELDEDLYYFNARYYDPNLGRFTSVDPVKDNHAYSYVMNNPMNFIDPTGMEEEERTTLDMVKEKLDLVEDGGLIVDLLTVEMIEEKDGFIYFQTARGEGFNKGISNYPSEVSKEDFDDFFYSLLFVGYMDHYGDLEGGNINIMRRAWVLFGERLAHDLSPHSSFKRERIGLYEKWGGGFKVSDPLWWIGLERIERDDYRLARDFFKKDSVFYTLYDYMSEHNIVKKPLLENKLDRKIREHAGIPEPPTTLEKTGSAAFSALEKMKPISDWLARHGIGLGAKNYHRN